MERYFSNNSNNSESGSDEGFEINNIEIIERNRTI